MSDVEYGELQVQFWTELIDREVIPRPRDDPEGAWFSPGDSFVEDDVVRGVSTKLIKDEVEDVVENVDAYQVVLTGNGGLEQCPEFVKDNLGMDGVRGVGESAYLLGDSGSSDTILADLEYDRDRFENAFGLVEQDGGNISGAVFFYLEDWDQRDEVSGRHDLGEVGMVLTRNNIQDAGGILTGNPDHYDVQEGEFEDSVRRNANNGLGRAYINY